MSGTSVSRIAYYLVMIGAVLMIVLGIVSFAQLEFGRFFFYWGYAYGGIVTVICGIIAIVGAKNASTLVWAVVLIIVGLVGGGLGGLLVLLGGIFGLVTTISKKV